MSLSGWRVLFWAPRVLTIAFILFLGLFALDAFQESAPLHQMILGFLIHLIPNLVLLLVLLVAWRWEWVGALGYAALAVFYLVETWGQFHWSAFAIISGTLGIMALLFLTNWFFHDRVRGVRVAGT